jgi:hypothetical protein
MEVVAVLDTDVLREQILPGLATKPLTSLVALIASAAGWV